MLLPEVKAVDAELVGEGFLQSFSSIGAGMNVVPSLYAHTAGMSFFVSESERITKHGKQ